MKSLNAAPTSGNDLCIDSEGGDGERCEHAQTFGKLMSFILAQTIFANDALGDTRCSACHSAISTAEGKGGRETNHHTLLQPIA